MRLINLSGLTLGIAAGLWAARFVQELAGQPSRRGLYDEGRMVRSGG